MAESGLTPSSFIGLSGMPVASMWSSFPGLIPPVWREGTGCADTVADIVPEKDAGVDKSVKCAEILEPSRVMVSRAVWVDKRVLRNEIRGW